MRVGNKLSSETNRIEFAALESRTMYHGATGTQAPDFTELPSAAQIARAAQIQAFVGAAHPAASIPALSSSPGAKATIYLDFNGDAAQQWGSYSVPATPAYNGSSDDIKEIWTRVTEKYAAFNVNVTTVDPGNFANGKALKVVIGGDGSWSNQTAGGLTYVGAFTSSMPNVSFVFSDNLGAGFPAYVAEAASHEAGHAFGLEHQASFSGSSGNLGNKVSDYSDNNGSTATAPTMGNSYSATRGLWWSGYDSEGNLQSDMTTIGSSTNGFGFRADDYSSSITNGKGLKLSGGHVTVHGVISSTSDKDCFTFSVGRGNITLKLRGADFGATLDGTISLYTLSGQLVGRANTSNLNETLSKTVAAGTYVAVVSSHGSYGDVGQYTLYAYGVMPSGAKAAPQAVTGGMVNTPVNPFSTTPIKGTTLADELIA